MSESDKKAAYMLVVAQIHDGKKMGQYQAALTASELYPKNHGDYQVRGRPIEMFEGEWPGNQAVVIAKFASADDARSFWHSDVYQNEIKPLRAGAGSFTVALFEELEE
jgi:uncharacterized protein (DUF1330 family)